MSTQRLLLWWSFGCLVYLWSLPAFAQYNLPPTWHSDRASGWRATQSLLSGSDARSVGRWHRNASNHRSFASLARTRGSSMHLAQRYPLMHQRPGTLCCGAAALGIKRQAVIDGGAVILSLPVLIVDVVPLLGNIIALSSGAGRFGWGIAGLGFSALGVLLMIPSFGIPGVALALGILQAALFGLSLTNLILALQERHANRTSRDALAAVPSLRRLHTSLQLGF